MEVYADSLISCMNEQDVQTEQLRPGSSLERFAESRFIMRYLRYWRYPKLVKSLAGPSPAIHHVTDHGYAHLYPSLRKGKKIISVHDLIPMLTWKQKIKSLPESSLSNRKPSLNLHSLSFVKRYDHVITISRNSARDLVHYLGLDKNRISVVPPVLDSKFQPLTNDTVEAFKIRTGLDDGSKWVMLSGSEFYKNHRVALSAIKRLQAQSRDQISIVKSGLPSLEFERLARELKVTNKIRYLYLNSHDELPLLYNAVDVLLFPSLYEGFGMPVTEALACGTPVVMSDRGALPEAGGDLAISCDALDISEIAEGLNTALRDDDIAQKVREEGPQWLSQFDSATIGHRLNQVYEGVRSD